MVGYVVESAGETKNLVQPTGYPLQATPRHKKISLVTSHCRATSVQPPLCGLFLPMFPASMSTDRYSMLMLYPLSIESKPLQHPPRQSDHNKKPDPH
jgi:hypothetical protein